MSIPPLNTQILHAPSPPDDRPTCCLELISNAVRDFFDSMAQAIYSVTNWTCQSLEIVCCSCCEDDEELDLTPLPPPIVNDQRKPEKPAEPIVQLPVIEIEPVVEVPAIVEPAPVEPPVKMAFEHVDIADMGERKIAALARLKEIEKNHPEFECVPAVLTFNLEKELACYKGLEPYSKFLDLFDYCYPAPRLEKIEDKRFGFDVILTKHEDKEYRKYYGYEFRSELAIVVELEVRQLYDMLNAKKESLGDKPTEKEELELKILIESTITRLIQAHTDGCIVQTNSQMGNICADVLAQLGKQGEDKDREKAQIQLMSGVSLYKHRRNLIHRLTKELMGGSEEVSQEESLRDAIEGSGYTWGTATLAKNKFDSLYTQAPTDGSLDLRPIPYLIRGINTSDAIEDTGTLKMDLPKWAGKFYDLDTEDETTESIIKLASKKTKEGADGDAFIMCSTDLSETGVKWLLEAAGAIREKIKYY